MLKGERIKKKKLPKVKGPINTCLYNYPKFLNFLFLRTCPGKL